MSTVSGQRVVNCLIETIWCQLMDGNCWLSTVGCQLLADNCWMSTGDYQLLDGNCWVSIHGCKLLSVNWWIATVAVKCCMSAMNGNFGCKILVVKCWMSILGYWRAPTSYLDIYLVFLLLLQVCSKMATAPLSNVNYVHTELSMLFRKDHTKPSVQLRWDHIMPGR